MGDGGSALAHQLPGVQRRPDGKTGAEALGHGGLPAHVADVGRARKDVVRCRPRRHFIDQARFAVAAGERFPVLAAGVGNVFHAVIDIVRAQGCANFSGECALFRAPGRRAVMANRLIHRRFQRAVGQIAGTGFFEATADAGLGHQRRALGDFLDPGEDLLRVGHFRRANEIQHLRLRLNNVG